MSPTLGELLPNQVVAEFGIHNDGHMRQEIEIGLMTLNGNKFIGTITPQEAKFLILTNVVEMFEI